MKKILIYDYIFFSYEQYEKIHDFLMKNSSLPMKTPSFPMKIWILL
jgi:hypothetical protein